MEGGKAVQLIVTINFAAGTPANPKYFDGDD